MPSCLLTLYHRVPPAVRVLILVIIVFVASFPPAGKASAAVITTADWAVAKGQFFTQTGGTGRGFVVSDEQGIPFLSELKARGGTAAIGYPISARFEWKGFTVQAFQKAVLQWMPGEKRVAFINVFDDLGAAGLDSWLRTVRSTPGHAWIANEDKMQWDAVVEARQELLVVNQGIRARYFAVPDPITLYGLPSSYVEDMGNHYAIRLQRAVIQQWKVDVPWAAAGETTVANGGDIAKEAGLFPANALLPTGPDGVTATSTATAVRSAVAVASPTPTPIIPVASATQTVTGTVTPIPIPLVNPGASTVTSTITATGQTTPTVAGTPSVSPTLTPTPTPTPTPTRVSPFRIAPIAAIPPPGQAKRVIIDPGHGGNQVGASAVFSDGARLYEKNLTLEIARRTATLLRQAGYQVALTRDADVQAGGPNLPDDLQARLDLANNFKADVFISIHHNGISSRDIKGFEVYFALDRPFSTDNKALADVLFQQIGRQIYLAGYDPLARGVIPDTSGADPEHFFLLSPESKKVKRPGLMPAAIVESLFLTNAEDAAALRRPEIREAVARGAAIAVGTFLTGRKPTF